MAEQRVIRIRPKSFDADWRADLEAVGVKVPDHIPELAPVNHAPMPFSLEVDMRSKEVVKRIVGVTPNAVYGRDIYSWEEFCGMLEKTRRTGGGKIPEFAIDLQGELGIKKEAWLVVAENHWRCQIGVLNLLEKHNEKICILKKTHEGNRHDENWQNHLYLLDPEPWAQELDEIANRGDGWFWDPPILENVSNLEECLDSWVEYDCDPNSREIYTYKNGEKRYYKLHSSAFPELLTEGKGWFGWYLDDGTHYLIFELVEEEELPSENSNAGAGGE